MAQSPARPIALKCQSCAADLQAHPSQETLTCAYCGVENLVPAYTEARDLRRTADAGERGAMASERTADEITLQRLEREYAENQRSWTSRQDAFAGYVKRLLVRASVGVGAALVFGLQVLAFSGVWFAGAFILGIGAAALGFSIWRYKESRKQEDSAQEKLRARSLDLRRQIEAIRVRRATLKP